ncbi:recombinase family protein [Deinococcus frigens]|uniref:recombinase family protein n=1 Tax=Deinococcus frigens TaxID=249403 RepID=UPI00068E030B|nr:recombinase family protein [Deinococcus frigens]
MTSRAATYTRVSTEEQLTNHSLETQATKLAAFADQQGLTVVRQYVDGGHSGAKRDRPALAQLLADAGAGLFDTMLIYRLDRLARSTHLAYSLIQELLDAGVGVKSFSEPQIDSTTPMGKVSLGVTAIFAELERDTFMQRSRDGTRKAVEKGVYSGGITAYGYTTQDKRLVVHDEEAEVVRMIFGWCVERSWSNIRIAEELSRLNIPTRYRRDGRGLRGQATSAHWRPGAILRILKNTTYKGEYRYGKRNTKGPSGQNGITTAPCPAIVTPEVWEAAQSTLSRNRLTALKNAKHIYMLKSLIRCGTCGRTYCGTKGSTWEGYACLGRTSRSSTARAEKCRSPGLSMRDIEAHVWDRIVTVLGDPAAHLAAQPLTLIPAELPHVEGALVDARRSRSRLTDLYLDPSGALDKAEYLSRLSVLDGQLATLGARLTELRDADAQVQARARHEAHVHALSGQYRGALDGADDTLRQRLAHEFVERIVVQGDGSVDVAWKV